MSVAHRLPTDRIGSASSLTAVSPAPRVRLGLALVLAALAPVEALAVAPPERPRLDRYGDPLPRGAVARLGSMRLRHSRTSGLQIALSPDGAHLASLHRTLRLWDRASGRLLWEREVIELSAGGVGFTPDGKELLSGHWSVGGTKVPVWDVKTGQSRPLWNGLKERGTPRHFHFSRDGKTLAFLSTGREKGNDFTRIYVFDYPAGKQRAAILVENGWSRDDMALSPDGRRVVFPSSDSLRVWDVSGRAKELRRIKLANRIEGPLLFAPEGDTLVTRLHNGGVVSFALASPEKMVKSEAAGYGLTFSDDGKEVLAWNEDGLHAIDPGTGRRTRQVAPSLKPLGEVYAVSPDGRWGVGRIAACLTVLDCKTGKLAPSFDDHRDGGPILEVAFSADSRRVATLAREEVRLWELPSGKILRRLPGKFLPGMRWTADRKFLVLPEAREKRVVLAWRDAETGKIVREVPPVNDKVFGASLLADEKTILWTSGDPDGEASLFLHALGKEQGPLTFAWKGPAESLPILSPDWRFALHRDISPDRETRLLRLKDVRTGAVLREGQGPRYGALGWFSPDGGAALWAFGSREAVAWRTKTGAFRGKVAFPEWSFQQGALCSSPDGKTLCWGQTPERLRRFGDFRMFWGAEETQVRLSELATGQVRCELPLVDKVERAAYTPDGRRLLTMGEEGSALVWDVYALAAGRGLDHARDDLGGADAKKAFAAVCDLVAEPALVLPLLADLLRPVRVDDKQLARWLRDLDSDKYEARAEADRRLAALGDRIEGDLHRELATAPSLEASARLRRLAKRLEETSPEALRRARALEALSAIESREATDLLRTLAAGHPGSRLALDAQEALARRKGGR